MNSILEMITSILKSGQFQSIGKGIEYISPFGISYTLKTDSIKRSFRSSHYQFVKYSYVTKVSIDSSEIVYGYGESDFKLLAIEKSISEAIERAVFMIYANETDSPFDQNTNGWAAHLDRLKARESAKNELLERDAILLHWLSETPETKIDMGQLPRKFKEFQLRLSKSERFNRLQFFVTNIASKPVASAMILDQNHYGYISHAAGNTLTHALEKALIETCRIAHYSEVSDQNKRLRSNLVTPDDHARYYSTRESFPKWIFEGDCKSFSDLNRTWNSSKTNENFNPGDFQFEEYQCADLFIARCQNHKIQNLYFGSTTEAIESGLINFERFDNFFKGKSISLFPHFVP